MRRAAPEETQLSYSPTIAAIRFGYGLSPDIAPPADPQALLAGLRAPDMVATTYPLPSLVQAVDGARALREARAMDKMAGDRSRQDRVRAARLALRRAQAQAFVSQLQRAVHAPDGFRERLQYFWANHFTVAAKGPAMALLPYAFAEEAIRPHLAGHFADMLKAATTHPAMLVYLDQNSSVGPHSRAARRADAAHKRKFGLNENLARELLELHTLGVGAPYTQTDVRQFAKLLTGLGFNSEGGFVFRPGRAEPGAETVLGRRYGGDEPARLSDIYAALDDIAAHPATAQHLSRELAVHFVSDQPDPDMVAAMSAAFQRSDGHLPTVYAEMLAHPAAWAPIGPGAKARQPWDFIAASLRGLGTPPETLAGFDPGRVQRFLALPLKLMGQPWLQPSGPDGWHEDASAWITPQGLAARIGWAMKAGRFADGDLPDPREFVQTALAEAASPTLITAARRAESKAEGVGLILASADFNRR